jgi:HEAT repeat protein
MMGEAALALGKIGDRRATPALLRVLSEQEVEPEAQTQVMWAIGTLGDVAALPVLEGVLQGNDDRLVYLAAEAMGRIGRIESADALVSLLDAKEHDTREMAVWALEKVSGQRLGQDPQAWRSWLSSRDGQQEGAP